MTKTSAPSLTQEAYDRLRAELLSCQIAPGEPIRINKLAETMGFSLGAVREALSRLTADGLVISEPQRGFRAAPVSIADLEDLTGVRIRIETDCLVRSIACGDVAWEGEVVAAYHRLKRTPSLTTDSKAPRLNDDWGRAHSDFHAALIAACDSPWLLRLRTQLYLQSERYRQLSVPAQSSDRDIDAEHKALMDAALSRSTAIATKLLESHLTRTMHILIDAFGRGRFAVSVSS